MANDLGYTPGSGALVSTIQASSDASHVQLVALSAIEATGDRSPIPADPNNGLGVEILAISPTLSLPITNYAGGRLTVDASQTNLSVQNVTGGSLTVGAPVGTPVAVRISNGSAFVDTIPVSIGGTVTVAGTVNVGNTPSVAQSGTWNIGTVTSITNTVTVAGSVSVTGTATVAGTVTANQGTPAAVANAWPAKVTDGTNTVGTTLTGGKYGLNVQVIGQTGGGYSQQDLTAFTVGTTPVEVIGGIYDDSIATAPSAGQVTVLRLTLARGLHVNLRDSSGNELGGSADPLYVQAVGTNFPHNLVQVGGTAVVTAAAGVQKVGISDAGGNAFSQVNPLQTQNAPSGQTGGATQTIFRSSVNLTALSSGNVLHTPVGGQRFFLEALVIVVAGTGAGSYQITVYDNTNSASTILWQGVAPAGVYTLTPARPIASAAANNVLRVDITGSGTVNCWITAIGYDA